LNTEDITRLEKIVSKTFQPGDVLRLERLVSFLSEVNRDATDEKKAELEMLNRFLTVARQLEGELPAFEPARKNDKILSDNDFL
jgi:hypothetical protein